MSEAAPTQGWTADSFLQADQHGFGEAWRYELVDGQIVAHAAPSPDHAAILAGLTTALGNRLRGNPRGCRPEAGSGAVPTRQQRDTARIPDLMIRCGDQPVVVFEIVSPSELRARNAPDRKRRDLMDTASIVEIVEVYQDFAAHIYRRQPDAWTFALVEGAEATVHLESVAIELPLAESFEFVA